MMSLMRNPSAPDSSVSEADPMAETDTLPLDGSGPDPDATTTSPGKRGPGRPKGSRNKTGDETGGSTTRAPSSRTVQTRLERTFERIGNILKNRGDDELGDAVIEERKPMAEGLSNLTDRVPKSRPPLIVALEALEALLGFGRVGGILFRRARSKQLEAQEIAEQLAAEDLAAWEAAEVERNGFAGEPVRQ
jgi:hypothetical protein